MIGTIAVLIVLVVVFIVICFAFCGEPIEEPRLGLSEAEIICDLLSRIEKK